jgi:hypothetical protein
LTPEQFREVEQHKTRVEYEASQPKYEDRLETAREIVGFAGDQMEGEDALRLISLVANLTSLYRQKKPEVTPKHILTKAYGSAESKGALKQYDQICILAELFITPNAKFSMHGFKSADEMLQEIRRIMDLWLPF